jgi:hypothetical protein
VFGARRFNNGLFEILGSPPDLGVGEASNLLEDLSSVGAGWRIKGGVERDADHAAHWLAFYYNAELEIMTKRMGERGVLYSQHLARSEEYSSIAIFSRLSSASKGGFTQYAAYIQKISRDCFFSIE